MGEETYSEGFVYDDHGRLTSKTVTQAGTETTVTNTYDALSRLSTRTGPVSKATYSYFIGLSKPFTVQLSIADSARTTSRQAKASIIGRLFIGEIRFNLSVFLKELEW